MGTWESYFITFLEISASFFDKVRNLDNPTCTYIRGFTKFGIKVL